MKESIFEKRAIALLEEAGAVVEHLQGDKGHSDVIGCYKGFYFALEFKSPTTSYTVTPIQQVKLRKLRKAGAVAIKVDNLDILRDMLNYLDYKATLLIDHAEDNLYTEFLKDN